MSELTYLTADKVAEVKTTEVPTNPSVSGYGPKIPTRYMLKIDNRWYRVYSMVYGNSGAPYVSIMGQVHHLSIDVEHMLGALQV